jgi:hypothetical protein
MQRMTFVAMAAMLAATPAFAEGAGSNASDAASTTLAQAKPATIAPAGAPPAAHAAP